MVNNRNNKNLTRLLNALLLNDRQIVEIMDAGGMSISRSKANGWKRGENTLKKSDPGSRDPENRERRMKIMDDDEFDAFCEGLAIWMRQRNKGNS